MAAKRVRTESNPDEPRPRPATTPQGRENQLISLAVDLAEEQLRAGTASSQVISHYLKMSSSREHLEQERIRGEISINKAKEEMLASQKRVEELYAKALKSMRSYDGRVESPEEV